MTLLALLLRYLDSGLSHDDVMVVDALVNLGSCIRYTRMEWVQLDSFIRHCVKLRYCAPDTPPIETLYLLLLLSSCAKSHMLSAMQSTAASLIRFMQGQQTAVNWSMDNRRCVSWTSPQPHSSLSVKPHFLWHAPHGPGLSESDSIVSTDVCEDQNREVGLWGLPLKWNWPP